MRAPQSTTRAARETVLAVGVLVAVLLAGACSSGTSPSPPPRAPLTGEIVEWNLAGYALHRGAATPADALAQQVRSRPVPPVAVVTEETCASQFNRLRDLLGPLGYQGAANWSIPAFGRPGCSSFGNTVFWRGGLAPDGVQKVTYRAALQAEGAATQEKRNLLCAAFTVPETATTRATPMRVCGTHLHRDPRVSARQAPALLDVVDRDNATGPPTLLLGDLNLQPDAPALDAFYRRYSEADPAPRTQPRPTTTGKVPVKLDYGFVPSGPVRVTQPADVIPVPTVSDHALYVLHFAFA